MSDKHTVLLQRYGPMSKAQLKAVVLKYASYFPDWTVDLGDNAIVRCSGPIRQVIWFQRMSFAAYRPTSGISSLVLPTAYIRMLPQNLDVKHREIEYRWHDRKFDDVLLAVKDQFKPDPSEPLNLIKVLALCRAEAASMPDTANNMTMLAILCAWNGEDEEALNYCQRAQCCSAATLAPMPEWEGAMRDFSGHLANAVRGGLARQYLISMVTQ